MNYYEHHIGDYAEATSHLSFVEDAAYSRLIRKYYAQEKPLPSDLKAVQRLVGARAKEEREAVQTILDEFFELQDDGWHNTRCDEELDRYREKAEGRDEKRESEKERQRRHRQRRKELFEALRSRGITPSFDTSTDELVTLLSRVTSSDASHGVTEPVTRDATATQTPDTNHQTPVLNPLAHRASTQPELARGVEGLEEAEKLDVTPAARLSQAMRKHGVMSQPGDPRLIALADQGVTIETIEAACEEAKQSKPNERIGPAYIAAIIQRWSSEAKTIDATGAKPPESKSNGSTPPADRWWLSKEGIERKGRELGMFARGTESHDDFKDRIFTKLRQQGAAA